LYLLTCGCQIAWFHQTCELTWINHIQAEDFPPRCPTCRRRAEFRLHYSLWWSDGINQKYFWWSLFLIGLDTFVAGLFAYKKGLTQAFYLPLQSSFILVLPFVSKSRHDLLYFLHHVRYHYLVFALSWVYHVFKYKQYKHLYEDSTVNLLIFAGFIHIVTLVLQEIRNYWSYDHYHMNPLTPFVIGYTFLHKDVLHFRKSSPSALESTKTSLPLRRSRI
jgi:hypothetical protein